MTQDRNGNTTTRTKVRENGEKGSLPGRLDLSRSRCRYDCINSSKLCGRHRQTTRARRRVRIQRLGSGPGQQSINYKCLDPRIDSKEHGYSRQDLKSNENTFYFHLARIPARISHPSHHRCTFSAAGQRSVDFGAEILQSFPWICAQQLDSDAKRILFRPSAMASPSGYPYRY